ncbi:MAG TPA: peptidylprolyl isomerase [Pilimelia sp.]|nr:peptidylprolyl isomerase [Pilimelia sp.]
MRRPLRASAAAAVAAAAAIAATAAAPHPTAASTVPAPTVTCQFTPTPENPPARPVTPPPPQAPATGALAVTLATDRGDVVLEFDRGNAPCAVHNFAHLAAHAFYDDSRCWRLTTSPRLGVLQCGDIVKAEVGGPGYRFPDELTGRETYPRGTVAMGNQGPDTNGSQFFLVHSVARIKPDYTVLGRVVSGLDVLDRIAAGGTEDGGEDGPPWLPVRIQGVRLSG